MKRAIKLPALQCRSNQKEYPEIQKQLENKTVRNILEMFPQRYSKDFAPSTQDSKQYTKDLTKIFKLRILYTL